MADMTPSTDIAALFEHPEWQKPLFSALQARGVPFEAIDLEKASFDGDQIPAARLYFNQASPSAYLPDVPPEAIEEAERISAAGGLDVCGIEYLETEDGRRVFYDVNANSNLRPPIARAFGFDPFERVVDYLLRQLGE